MGNTRGCIFENTFQVPAQFAAKPVDNRMCSTSAIHFANAMLEMICY